MIAACLEISITLTLAYLCFFTAEGLFGVSSVLAIVSCGVVSRPDRFGRTAAIDCIAHAECSVAGVAPGSAAGRMPAPAINGLIVLRFCVVCSTWLLLVRQELHRVWSIPWRYSGEPATAPSALRITACLHTAVCR